MAYGVLLGLFRRGNRVPDDVSFIGFDDQRASAYTIPP
jgi:DNA-binding LacI/PurR family transcriptional regulator